MATSRLEKNAQVSFRTNAELLAEAKKIISRTDFDMSAVYNAFLKKIVETQEVPMNLFETKESRDESMAELFNELRGSYEFFKAGGKGKSIDEVFSKYGV
ncbi:MAG: addiction module antitoxin RelB [Streptococcaceae bacterium]|jgi:addiction module RelB/DinJ family antitoxin|nr:addiction module antitoxin RelB [Streptococcaceae bacterium]